jgi:hypothetical protein
MLLVRPCTGFVVESFCRSVVLLFCRFVVLSFCRFVVLQFVVPAGEPGSRAGPVAVSLAVLAARDD